MACRRIESVSQSAVEHQWNNLANIRLLQILSGEDITYNRVLMPAVFSAIGTRRFAHCLDVGCGVGVLTSALQVYSREVTGIDISAKSVHLAERTFSGDRVRYLNESVEAHAALITERYDLVVANMFLMDAINLDAVIDAVWKVLRPEGVMLSVLPHPAFWPEHYGYGTEAWFDYSSEFAVECNFHISLSASDLSTVHFHRPLARYLDTFLKRGLTLVDFKEILPPPEVQALYPLPWKGPRYILFECRR